MEFAITTTDERAVLGCALIGTQSAHSVFSQLVPEDFSDGACADAFEQMRGVWEKCGRVDIATVCRLPSAGLLMACAETVPSLSGCEIYIQHVKHAAIGRKAAAVALEIATGNLGPDELSQKIGELSQIVNGGAKPRGYDMVELLSRFLVRRTLGVKPEYLHVGLGLDKRLRLRGGNLLVIGARPSVGKTAFALQLALTLAGSGKRVAFFSLETDADTVTDRMVACMCKYDYAKLQDNEIDYTTRRAAKEFDLLSKYPIAVVEASGKTAAWMEAEAKRRNADVMVVDYLGLVPSRGKDLYERTTNASMAFHNAAQRSGMLVILLSQLNRAGTDVPRLEHLRESGQIEQDADAVILLHNDEAAQKYAAIVAKNKNGRCAAVALRFEKETQHFTEVAPYEADR